MRTKLLPTHVDASYEQSRTRVRFPAPPPIETAKRTRVRWGKPRRLDVVDDGPGFDAGELVRSPQEAHFGLRVLADLAEQGNALLQVASAPGQGTHWRLVLAVDGRGARR